jgi:hypothetical protein
LEDQDHEEELDGDLDDHLEPQENEEDEEVFQDSPIHSENKGEDLANLDTTVSGISPDSGSIKIICGFHSSTDLSIIFASWCLICTHQHAGPNGVVQEYRGRFTVSTMMNIKSGGKVIVETDENGIPNQKSAGLLGSFLRDLARNSSHVSLYIPRWDNKLMQKPKKDLITYVVVLFMGKNSVKLVVLLY